MMDRFEYISGYFKYLLNKKGKHGIHSPFVFDFITKVLEDRKDYPEYKRLDKTRHNLLSDTNIIETVDFGSGAKNKEFITFRSSVKHLTKLRSQSIREMRLLMRIVKYFKPATILEFGTSTGLGTISLALGNPQAKVITMEGCASIASVAESQFRRNDIDNIEVIIGNFNNVLTDVLEKMTMLDLVFFDGNHRKIPTLDYFNHCLAKAGEKSVFIFDDIHWSAEMEEAWIEIQQNKSVTLTLDLFHLGIVFFHKGIEKQHFVLNN
jgi:predicted O-methyltransferase YrrM